MGSGISFVWGENGDERDVEMECEAEDHAPMPGAYNVAASQAPVTSGVAISREGVPHQGVSLQAITRSPTVRSGPEANPGAIAISPGRQESALIDGAGARHESLAAPPQLTQFNLQGSSLTGNTIVSGNLTQITNVVQPVGVPEQKLEIILEWLAPKVNFRSIYIQNLEKCAEGTLSWFLTGEKYDEWKNGKTKVIWGMGIPGAGKTVLASRLIEDLEKQPDKKICILYAYCRYTEALSVKDILEGLIKQCLERHPEIAPVIIPVLERHRREKTRPSLNELMDLLRTIEQHFDIVFYIIDGLDEAKIATQFDLVKAINSLGGRFAITSRPLQTLEGDLHSAAFYPVCAHREDIERLVREKIDQHSHLRRLLELHRCEQRIISAIVDKSGGMFIHAALQVDALGFCSSLRDLEDVLKNLPLSLKDMYRQTVQRIKARSPAQADLGMRALLWVVFSLDKERFGIEHLLYAVATDPETHVFDEERMVDEAALISACCGLIEVQDTYWGRSVRLVHYSAQEALATILLECCPHPHTMILQTLMQRLISLGLPQSHVEDNEALRNILEQPLARYAYDHWHSHFHRCKGIPKIASEVLQFLKQCTSFPLRTSLPFYGYAFARANPLHLAAYYDLIGFIPKLVSEDGVSPDGQYNVNSTTASHTPLSIASELGHVEIMEELLCCRTTDPNLHTEHGTALVGAARGSTFSALVRLLQVKDIHVNATDQQGTTALMYAAENDTASEVEALLQHPEIDVNARDNNGDTALIHASRSNISADTIAFLLRADGIQVNAANRKGQTALIEATAPCIESHNVEQLLECDELDVNAADEDGDTALIRAARRYDGAPMVRLLLQADSIQVNSANRRRQTALIAAFQCDTVFLGDDVARVVHELLQCVDLDVNASDEDGDTALIHAARSRDALTVRLLLQADGIQVNTANRRGETALIAALQCDEESVAEAIEESVAEAIEEAVAEVIEELLECVDLDVNAADQNGDTALIHAARWHIAAAPMVRLLLQADGIQVNTANRRGETALIAAFQSDENFQARAVAGVVQELLQCVDLDVNATDENGDTALICAVRRCYVPNDDFRGAELLNIIRRLLQHDGIQVNAANRNGHSVLMIASDRGYTDIVGELLQSKWVNVAAVDPNGDTAAILAARAGHDDVVDQLIQADQAVLNMANAEGQTPLIVASPHGHASTVLRLLQSGKVDVNAVDKSGSTALLAASTDNHWPVILHLLRADGIRVNQANHKRRTALMQASKFGHYTSASILLRCQNIDINARDSLGNTALTFAAFNGHSTLVQILIDHGGVDANSANYYGRTALIYAAWARHEEVVEQLLQSGMVSDVGHKDTYGYDAVMYASMEPGHDGIIRLLNDYHSMSTST
ncbi:ankyrin repeat domain-containing protein 50 [Coprinopsis cinerea AmutBmut pab1-1]|nr:ankyrin repeat domain-containing protein 50 [Coprinopsis cinerea AmutBmut pab1-1]